MRYLSVFDKDGDILKAVIVTVAGRAGHSRTSTTTDIYSKFIKSSDEAAAETLENLLVPNTSIEEE